VSGERANDREAHIHRRLCAEGGRTYLGRSAACYGNVTESGVIHSDRAAEVSRRHSTHESEEGRKREVSRSRDSGTDCGGKSSTVWPAGGQGKGEAQLDPPVQGTNVSWRNLHPTPGAGRCLTRAQLAEPPYADPHVRWCGREERATVPPIPIDDVLRV
jgi:hypothetical protein